MKTLNLLEYTKYRQLKTTYSTGLQLQIQWLLFHSFPRYARHSTWLKECADATAQQKRKMLSKDKTKYRDSYFYKEKNFCLYSTFVF